MTNIQRFESGPRMSQAVIYPAGASIVVLAGQVPNDTSLDVVGQTRDVLAKIDRLLHDTGSQRTDLLSATIWLREIGDFALMNTVWDDWVVAGHAPVRACVEARLAAPEIRVEIQVSALIRA